MKCLPIIGYIFGGPSFNAINKSLSLHYLSHQNTNAIEALL